MGSHMKTTVEIADPLFHEAKRVAAKEGKTLRQLIEEGLRAVLHGPASKNKKKYVMPDTTFKGGGGLTEEAQKMTMHELIYESYGDRL